MRRRACRLLGGEYAGECAATSQHRSVRRGVDIACQCGRVVTPGGVPPGKRLMCADIGELAIDIAGCQCGREVASKVRAAWQAPDVRGHW